MSMIRVPVWSKFDFVIVVFVCPFDGIWQICFSVVKVESSVTFRILHKQKGRNVTKLLLSRTSISFFIYSKSYLTNWIRDWPHCLLWALHFHSSTSVRCLFHIEKTPKYLIAYSWSILIKGHFYISVVYF